MNKTTKLTMKQRNALEAVRRLNTGTTVPPSVRDLQRELGGRSTQPVYAMILKLEAMGLVTRTEGIARSLILTAQGESVVGASETDCTVPFYKREEDGRITDSPDRLALSSKLIKRHGKIVAVTVLAGQRHLFWPLLLPPVEVPTAAPTVFVCGYAEIAAALTLGLRSGSGPDVYKHPLAREVPRYFGSQYLADLFFESRT